MIKSFGTKDTERLWRRERVPTTERICFVRTDSGPEEVEIVDYN